jgi:Flp pilus assembly protein TadD
MAHYERGLALANPGTWDGAIAEYRAAIRIKPDYAEAHSSLGLVLAVQGKLDDAIAEYRKARDNAQRGSELAELIGKALNEFDH